MSESMHYTPRVTFQEPNLGTIRGSLPDLRPDCACGCPRARMGRNITCASRYGDSCASTESLIDEAEDFLRKSIDGVLIHDNEQTKTVIPPGRLSENDMKGEKKKLIFIFLNEFKNNKKTIFILGQ